MPSEFPMNDPQNIWKNQPTEPFTMSANELCRKAQQHESKARFETLYSIIVGLILFVFFAWRFVQPYEVVPRMGVGLLSLWGIYYAYQAYKWIWPGRLTPDAALNTTLQSYRSELEKRRDYGRHLWRRAGLTFCVLGVAMVIVPALIKSLDTPRLLLNTLPFFVLLAIWLAVFLRLRKRNRGKLQQEIEELRALER
jgi:hypothetical protein